MIKYIDTPSVMQVIGGVYLNNELLDDNNYNFSENDFTEEFHKILFGSIYNLHLLGAEATTPEAIEHYLEQRPKAYAVFQSNKGKEYLGRLAEITQLSTFDYYYKRMKKMTLFRQYQKIGVDVSWLYNPDDILNIKKKQAQEDWFDNTSIEEMADLIDRRIEEIRLKYVDGINEDISQAGEGIDSFLEELKRNPEYGYPLFGPYINTITRGARLKKLYLRSAATGVGKALTNDTIIPTPIGFRRVGDIKPGDKLFGRDGKETTVAQIHPQPEKKKIYKVYFADGRVVKCCKDHLWQVKNNKNGKVFVESTEWLYKKGLEKGRYFRYNATYFWSVPLNQPIEIKERKHEVSIEEYSKNFINPLNENLAIDNEYLFDSIDNRRNLFLNIVPNFDNGGVTKFAVKSKDFANSLTNLIRSLGYYVINEPKRDENEEVIFYMLYIYATRKTVSITHIVETEEVADMTCFTVDNEEHLFLCNDYIVTHNTRAMIADACTLSCKEVFNIETGVWEEKEYCVPSLFIATEQDLGEVQTMMVAFVANVDEEHIVTGQYEDGEWERVKYAADIIKNSPIYVDELPDFSMDDIMKVIKKSIHDHDIKACFFDYIHSSMKILNEVSSKTGVKGLREDNVLFMISVKLKEIANKYGIFIMSSTQLNGDYTQSKIFDQNLLRGAKSIADSIDVGMIMLKVTKEDLQYLTSIMERGYDKPDIKISVYKNRRGRYESIILWCKARRETCRIIPMFVTDYSFELVDIKDTEIKIKGA